jgi:predicted Zn-dependent peptidase
MLLVFPAMSPLAAQASGAIAFEQYTLGNGLRVILAPDSTAPVVAVSVWYDVGSRDERPGQAGFAQLAQNLMFDGSVHLPPGAHLRLVEHAGGESSGETEDDVTRFIQVLPPHELALGLWLEADRLRGLKVNDTAIAIERRAIRAERQHRVGDQPYSTGFLRAGYAVYDSTGCFGYAHAPVPGADNLEAASVQSVTEFLRAYYTPANARLTIAGNFDPAKARATVSQYFEDVPAGTPRPSVNCAVAPRGRSVRIEVRDRLAALPAAGLYYRIPPTSHADTPALELLGIILGQGQRARLTVRLTRDANLAAGSQANLIARRRGPNVFGMFAVANRRLSADSIAHLLQAEATSIATDGVSEAELTRAKNYSRAAAVAARQRPQDVAEGLQHAANFWGAPDEVNADEARYQRVTAEDVRRVAQTYLAPNLALTMIILPVGP